VKRPRAALVVTWVGLGALNGLVLWISLGAVAVSLTGEDTWQGAIGNAVLVALLYFLYSPYLALLILVIAVPIYATVFWLWALICTKKPWLDSSWPPVLLAASGFALPPSLVISTVSVLGKEGVAWPKFLVLMLLYFTIFWGAIISPRWLVQSLAPGAFSGEPNQLESAKFS